MGRDDRSGSRPAQVSALERHSSTVWRPRVRRRVRPVLVGPSTSAETPRSIVSTRSVEVVEAQRHQLATPRPESAARRTSSRICSALWRRSASRGSAQATSASAASSRRSTSSVLRCSRVPGRGGPRMPERGLTSMTRSTCAQPMAERSTRKRPETTATETPAELHAGHGGPHVLGFER